MKKFLLCVLLHVSVLLGVEIAGFEFSPEVGVMGGKVSHSQNNAIKDYSAGAYGRVWIGVFDVVLAPQIKYSALFSEGDRDTFEKQSHIQNWQYGLLGGLNMDLTLLRLTPYVGLSRSHFNRFYEDTLAYSAGLKLKPALIPISLGVEYEHQKPSLKGSTIGHQMDSFQLFLGIHF